mgnify:CR=1 FL=1
MYNFVMHPTIVTLGQIISALKSGKYDLDKTAVFMSQTSRSSIAAFRERILIFAAPRLEPSSIFKTV